MLNTLSTCLLYLLKLYRMESRQNYRNFHLDWYRVINQDPVHYLLTCLWIYIIYLGNELNFSLMSIIFLKAARCFFDIMKKILYHLWTLDIVLNKFALFSTDYSNPLQFLMSSINMGVEPRNLLVFETHLYFSSFLFVTLWSIYNFTIIHYFWKTSMSSEITSSKSLGFQLKFTSIFVPPR